MRAVEVSLQDVCGFDSIKDREGFNRQPTDFMDRIL